MAVPGDHRRRVDEMGERAGALGPGQESLEVAEHEIMEVFSSPVNNSRSPEYNGFFGEVVGKCPLCGGEVVRGRYGFGCRNYKEGCKFSINGYICGRAISFENVRLLLENGATSKIQGFVSPRTGKEFDAFLTLENGKVKFKF